MDTETLDKMYLEYSQLTKARTQREKNMLNVIRMLNDMVCWNENHNDDSRQQVAKIVNDY